MNAPHDRRSLLAPWSVTAENLPEHARNPIHTDEGGRAAGFAGALVAGVTTYAYLTHPPAAGWGLDWVRSGWSEVRFLAPVCASDLVDCVPVDIDGATRVEARVGGELRAFADVGLGADPWGDEATTAEGVPEPLAPLYARLDGEFADYGKRAGDDLELYGREGIVHPAVWPALSNTVVHAQLARGSWIHTRSRIRHVDTAPVGGLAVVEATVRRRFDTRSGERAILDVTIDVDGRRVAQLEHEALVSLAR